MLHLTCVNSRLSKTRSSRIWAWDHSDREGTARSRHPCAPWRSFALRVRGSGGQAYRPRRSHELQRNAAERAEIRADRVALLRPDHAGERAGKHQMAGLERRTE